MELIAVRPTPPVRAALEKAPAYIKDDQLVEPKSIRSRKALLGPQRAQAHIPGQVKRICQRNSIMRPIAAMSQSAM
jgi:hypothetical protein